jgi:hypothetical protein
MEVVRPEVDHLRVVGSFPTQWTGLSTEMVSVGSRLHKPTVCTRPGGHRRQMEAWSRILRLTEHAYRHPIPMGQGECDGSLGSVQRAAHT